MKIIFATGSDVKFKRLAGRMSAHGIELEQKPVDVDELQIDSGKELSLQKLKDSYRSLEKPLMITDDSWDIPALNGFPGVNMKQTNLFFTPQDWLRLMNEVEDRRIFLIQHFAYTDGSNTIYDSFTEEATFIHESRGHIHHASVLSTIVWKGDDHTVAERLELKDMPIKEDLDGFVASFAQKVLDLNG